MKREDWRRAYEPLPDALDTRVSFTLSRLEEERPVRRLSLRTAAIVLALVLALCGAAYAVFESRTGELFGWLYGGSWKQDMDQGDFAPMGQTLTLGEVRYTVEEMVYKTEGEQKGLYGVIRIAPADGASIVLVSEDQSVNDPAGFLLNYGMETGQTIPDDAPSYAELAMQRGAKLVRAGVSVSGISASGKDCPNGYGESCLPQEDGSILVTLEIADQLPKADAYELLLKVDNRELTQEGFELTDENGGARKTQEWLVTVTPDAKGETK